MSRKLLILLQKSTFHAAFLSFGVFQLQIRPILVPETGTYIVHRLPNEPLARQEGGPDNQTADVLFSTRQFR